MDTLIFLDKINGAIAESFAPLLDKKFNYPDVHKIAFQAIKDLLPNELEYRTWYLGPNNRTFGPRAHEVNLFLLTTKGWSAYQGSFGGRSNTIGKFVTPPVYEQIETVKSLTIEGTIKNGAVGQINEHLAKAYTRLQDLEKQLGEQYDYLAALKIERERWLKK